MSRYLGDVSAYAYAVSKGYTGTEEEFAELMASYVSVAEDAGASARAAASSASDASASKTAAGQSEANAAQSESAAATSARQAQTAAGNAGQSETNAGNSASAAARSASQAALSATQAANSAQSANLAATDANTAKSGAEEAQTKAETAQTKAETAQGKAEEAQSEAEQAAQGISESLEQITTNKENIEALQTTVERKANIDGYYENLGSGTADQLNSTQYVEDSVPYLFRTTGGSADVGDRANVKTIVGGSLTWNQLVQNGNFTEVNNWSFNSEDYGSYSVQDNVATILVGPSAVNNTSTYFRNNLLKSAIDHVYLATIDVNPSVSISMRYQYPAAVSGTRSKVLTANVWQTYSSVVKAISVTNGAIFYINVNAVLAEGDTMLVKNAMVIDLTAMFGSTIADYIYSLEQASAGAGVAWFRRLFPKDYYAFNAGSMMHVEGLSSHDAVGFNLFDESLTGQIVGNYRKVSFPAGLLGKCYMSLIEKDASVTLPNNMACGFVRDDYDGSTLLVSNDFRWIMSNNNIRVNRSNTNGGVADSDGNKLLNAILVYPNTEAVWNLFKQKYSICINLSWSGWRNGEYEPYSKHSYPLDSSVILRGVPKLDSQNNLYYDGDRYLPDGTVERRYGIVDLGTLSWNYNSTYSRFDSQTDMGAKPAKDNNTKANAICDKYKNGHLNMLGSEDKFFYIASASGYGRIRVIDSAYNNATAFKAAMSGVYLVYELATPTTETADPYQETQIVDDFGTEEFVSTGIVPVGHETRYPANLRDKLQHLPDLADDDGYYVIQQADKQMSLVHFRIPQAPTTDGTYTLKATVSGGTPTYTWEAEA